MYLKTGIIHYIVFSIDCQLLAYNKNVFFKQDSKKYKNYKYNRLKKNGQKKLETCKKKKEKKVFLCPYSP